MLKTLLTIIIIAVVAVVIYFIARPSAEERAARDAGTEQEVVNETPETPDAGKKMAFSELVKQGGEYKCTVDINVGETTTEGTMYLDGEDVRGEYSVAVQGTTFNAFFLSDGEFAYVWSSAAPTAGIKMRIDATTTTSTNPEQALNYDQIGDYDCQPWTVDRSKFTVPTNVTFTTA